MCPCLNISFHFLFHFSMYFLKGMSWLEGNWQKTCHINYTRSEHENTRWKKRSKKTNLVWDFSLFFCACLCSYVYMYRWSFCSCACISLIDIGLVHDKLDSLASKEDPLRQILKEIGPPPIIAEGAFVHKWCGCFSVLFVRNFVTFSFAYAWTWICSCVYPVACVSVWMCFNLFYKKKTPLN